MTRRWLILADDLTGAADCAIALGGRGLAAVVTWGDIGSVRSRREPILAYDIASRGLSADAASAATKVTPKFVSPSDPAAQWTGAMRGPAFFAHSDNYLIDVKVGIILDVEASRAIRQAEVGASN
jgi:hypothetical protein